MTSLVPFDPEAYPSLHAITKSQQSRTHLVWDFLSLSGNEYAWGYSFTFHLEWFVYEGRGRGRPANRYYKTILIETSLEIEEVWGKAEQAAQKLIEEGLLDEHQ